MDKIYNYSTLIYIVWTTGDREPPVGNPSGDGGKIHSLRVRNNILCITEIFYATYIFMFNEEEHLDIKDG